MALFRLLHASDLHLAQTPDWVAPPSPRGLSPLTRALRLASHNEAILKAFARWLWENERNNAGDVQFDALLVTGDLATTGESADLKAAYDLFNQQPVMVPDPANPGQAKMGYLTAWGDATLQFWFTLLGLLPGNHDRYRSAYTLFLPGGGNFDTLFRSMAVATRQYICFNQGYYDGPEFPVQGNVLLHVLLADFSLRSNDRGKPHFKLPGWLGQGRVPSEIFFGTQAAPGLVKRTRAKRQGFRRHGWRPITVWAIHFDPFSTDGLLRLLDSDLLRDAAQQGGRGRDPLRAYPREQDQTVIGWDDGLRVRGSTTAAGEAHNDFQVLEIETPDDGTGPLTLRVTWFRYDLSAGGFIPLQTAAITR